MKRSENQNKLRRTKNKHANTLVANDGKIDMKKTTKNIYYAINKKETDKNVTLKVCNSITRPTLIYVRET